MKKTANALASLNTKKLLVCTLSFLALNNAHAATLGKMKVLSVLGASLKAEIELTNILPEEEANLVVKIASPDVFKRAGLQYNPALANIKATINKNSRPFKITLSSQAAISEPLLEILMDLNWQSGRLVRQYTVLLDPVSSANDNPDVLNDVPATSPQVIANSTVKPVNISKPVLATEKNLKTKKQAASNALNSSKRNLQKYTVKKGDTLYLITKNLAKGNTTQINQLMKLLVKNNPNSFINSDKNRLKSGVVLNTHSVQKIIPNLDKIDKIDKSDKADDKTLSNAAASKDFSRYKQAAANQSKVVKKDSTASKIVRNSVKTEVTKPLETIQDQLKVSGKAAVGASAVSASIKKNEEAKIAEERSKTEERAKLALLKKTLQASVNITNNTLAGVESKPDSNSPVPISKNDTAKSSIIDNLPVAATVAATAVIASPTIASPQVPVVTPTIPDVPSSLVNDSNTTIEALNKPVEIKPAETAIVSSNESNNISNNESSSIADWFTKIDTLTLGGIAAGLLGAIWFYFKRKKQKELQNFSDTQFNINDTQGTLLTADGGQAVDTFNSVFASTFSEMNNSESSEVDPVAEADVYMQYGRDAHAEDILKDALKQSPNRIPVHLKLMEIYANKNDHVALKEHFNIVAHLTQSSGEEWEQAKTILNQSLVHPSSISQVSESISNSNEKPTPASKEVDIKNNVKNNVKGLTSINSNSTTNFDYLNPAALKNKLPDISLSSPTQIGDVPTTINMNANLRANKKPENIVINGNINGNSNVKDALNMNVLKLDTPVSLISPASNINERALQPSISSNISPNELSKPTQLMTSNSILNFDIQAPTLISLPSSTTGVLKNTHYTHKGDSNSKLFINKTTMSPTHLGATLIKKNISDDTNFTSTTDFKLSKDDRLEANSILDKVTDDMHLGSNNINSGTQAIETKFSLAQAYLEIGDKEGAKELLNEVLKSGHQALSEQARAMLTKI
jgi:pilus assembly protein FimV